jgi:non-ribosomal peptide synthase protein (TIGR01720 family)
VQGIDPEPVRVPIGGPLANRSAYVLDDRLSPTPLGVPGELWLGGVGLARGYLGSPDLTAERFIPDAAGPPGSRMYRTGDRARWLPTGELEFLGRSDGQVKVRGFRVETGDVEAALRQHPLVRAAHATVRADPRGNLRLVAYVVAPANGGPGPTATGLRDHLRERVPDHMIPAEFVLLGRLPTLPNGKVDGRALPEPVWIGDRSEVSIAPRTPAEEILAGVWATVLGLERVGVNENFFELGGDSILSIQVVARARQAGLRVTPRQMFQLQTVAELAAVVCEVGTSPADRSDAGPGPFPLTPIQHWFLDQGSPEPHHYNLAILLKVRAGLGQDRLAAAVRSVFAHHDALRTRFVHVRSTWQQRVADLGESCPLEPVDLSSLPDRDGDAAVEAAATAIQTGLNLTVGPVARVAYFNFGPDRHGRLLWVVHHLVIDGVSWRILLEDFQTACRQLTQGQKIDLPPRTASFTLWAKYLAEFAGGPDLRAELPYWLDGLKRPVCPLPVDRPGGSACNASAQNASSELTADETHRLLTEVPTAYRAGINDVLLTALARAVANWTRSRTVLVDLEGHGREELFGDVDVSRTVGWFTSVFPVMLDLGPDPRPSAQVRAVREQLNRVPRRGLGYGLLRYVCREETVRQGMSDLPSAEVGFNYLGQFERVWAEGSAIKPAEEAVGPTQSPRMRLAYRFEVNAWVTGGRFHAEWTYSGDLYCRGTVERLADDFAASLRVLVEHARTPAAADWVPADFPDANLSQGELDRLISALRPSRGGTP